MFFGMECILDTFPSITVPLNEMNNGVCHLMCLFFVYAGRLHRWGLIVYRDIFLWWPDKFFAHFWCRSPGTLWGLKLEIPSHLSLTRTQRSVGRFSIFAAGRGRDFARQSSVHKKHRCIFGCTTLECVGGEYPPKWVSHLWLCSDRSGNGPACVHSTHKDGTLCYRQARGSLMKKATEWGTVETVSYWLQ